LSMRRPDRYAFVPFESRKPIRWPNDARVAVWIVPNVEFYELRPEAEKRWPRPVPDVLNYSLRDYGNRAGLWRLMDVLDRFGLRATVSLNAGLCDRLPQVVQACVDRDWELLSHGTYNTQVLYGMSEEETATTIRESVTTISSFSGRPVRGFLAPALSSTETFLDLLPQHGITYSLDLVHDDRPSPLRVRTGRLISVPYSAEINDVRLMYYRGYAPQQWASMQKAAFDQLYDEGKESGTVFCIALHPFVTGQPHRISALGDILSHLKARGGAWYATGSEIADWYYANAYDADLAGAAYPAA
jgi:allantoinase